MIFNSSAPTRTFPNEMLREIYEQPRAIQNTFSRHVRGEQIFTDALEGVSPALVAAEKIIIVASGSSRHAGLAGEVIIENLAGIAVDVEYASEYSHRMPPRVPDSVVIAITQSGETADTVAAQREAISRGAVTIAICNVPNSVVAQEAAAVLLTDAGPELSVPATKSFTTQLTVLFLLGLFLGKQRKLVSKESVQSWLDDLGSLPSRLDEKIAEWDSNIRTWAQQHRRFQSFLYLGRSVHYAIAREGALKLKEISYTQAEGYPTGELRHGPYALVSGQSPVVVLATCDQHDPGSRLRFKKTLAIIMDVKRRGGKVIALASDNSEQVQAVADHTLIVPSARELLLPILEVVPLQLLAYHIAVLNGCDVDHPRNLVKAVIRE